MDSEASVVVAKEPAKSSVNQQLVTSRTSYHISSVQKKDCEDEYLLLESATNKHPKPQAQISTCGKVESGNSKTSHKEINISDKEAKQKIIGVQKAMSEKHAEQMVPSESKEGHTFAINDYLKKEQESKREMAKAS